VIRVLVVSASPVTRAGLEALLRTSPNIEVAGSLSDWPRNRDIAPDVIVADWERAGEELPQDTTAVSVILLADDLDHTWTAEALRSGVRGVLPRDAAPDQILAAVEAAAAGLAVLQPDNLDSVLAAPRPARNPEFLSPREIEVLGMMAEGLSNKTIAYRLGISEHTVKFHITSIMSKLNAGSRTEAVTLGIRRGLILL
jgi:DNA-binding NarL/FixJ family response regulator